jgi:hypothetical protein
MFNYGTNVLLLVGLDRVMLFIYTFVVPDINASSLLELSMTPL